MNHASASAPEVLDLVLRLDRKLPFHALDRKGFSFFRDDEDIVAKADFRGRMDITAVVKTCITWPDVSRILSVRTSWLRVEDFPVTVIAGTDDAGRGAHAIGFRFRKTDCVVVNATILSSADADSDSLWLTALLIAVLDPSSRIVIDDAPARVAVLDIHVR